jgi:dipeptidyl-peptidase-4
MEWSPDGSQLMVQQMNRLQNTDRVMLADPKSGTTRTVLTETDDTWLENENPVRFIGGDQQFLWVSERDGWRHVYVANVDGSPLKLITPGEFDVIAVEGIDEANGWLYYSASPDNPTQRYLFRCHLDGTGTEPLTTGNQPGWHTCSLSPNADWAILTYSNFSTPPVKTLVKLSDRTVVRSLADNARLGQRLSTLNLPSSELFRVDIGDNTLLDCWCLMPPNLDKTRKYPLLIHVYGEPHGQTVRDAWFGPRGLWHWMLAQQGYIVASIENRGTIVPRGREWRKVVHRKIGQLASQDQAAATRALLQRWPFADEKRIGIWGWSGGGSMSLNAIFRYPDLYRTAMAVAPVPNQRLYDTIYQERYMGLPSDNANGYRDGSPLTFAHQLKGNLLIVHGTGDDNCHYQGVELLINELIARGKQFTVMPYPNRTHSISEGDNTTKHLYSLLTRYLQEHMPD